MPTSGRSEPPRPQLRDRRSAGRGPAVDPPDESPLEPDLYHIAPAGPVLPAMVAVVVVVLVLAILKPWAQPTTGVDLTPTPVEPTATPRATPIARSAPPSARPSHPVDAATCHAPAVWRVVVVERAATRERRTWFALRMLTTAQGPEDPSIPFRRVVSRDVVAMGFCAPEVGLGAGGRPGGPRADGVRVWQIRAGHPQALADLRLVEVPDSGIAELYRPSPAGARTWPSADYVFAVRDPDGREIWFGLHVVSPPG